MSIGGTRTINKQEKNEPLVSVITVVYNGVGSISETIQSVLNFSGPDIEYIVIDGGSTDGTLDAIKRYELQIDYWLSEQDDGIYDAINKGIAVSLGEYFYILNVGDRLITLPKEDLISARQHEADVILFNVSFPNGKVFRSHIDGRIRFGNTIHHQGAFYRRNMNVVYDLSYKVFSDFDLNQKLFKQRKRFIKFEKVISFHSLDGVSNDLKYRSEYFAVIRKNFGLFWMTVGALYIWQGEMRMKLRSMLSANFDAPMNK